MAVVKASITWPGPDVDVLRIYVEPTPGDWGAVVHDEDISVFRVLDDADEPTGEIAGLEIVGFLMFNNWGELPVIPFLWQLPGRKPVPLDVLLRQTQAELRQEIGAKAS